MRSVSDLTERIASLAPLSWGASSESDSEPTDEPVPDRYKCRNCGRESDPDVDVCPNCSSANLRPLFF